MCGAARALCNHLGRLWPAPDLHPVREQGPAALLAQQQASLLALPHPQGVAHPTRRCLSAHR